MVSGVLAKAELADNGPVRGTMVIRPYGYSIWERMQAEIDSRIKAAGVPNAYFPCSSPRATCAVRRRTSKASVPSSRSSPSGAARNSTSRWWCGPPVRPSSTPTSPSGSRATGTCRSSSTNGPTWSAGNAPRLFLRTTEFLWQEGHTAHATERDARAFALGILPDVYEDFMVNVLAVPVLAGRKTERERFSGATTTWTCEAMIRDGKALQMGTSHELGQNFARVFDTTFLDESGHEEHVWQTSWGASSRLMGALVMAHGDDNGLRIPPLLAPVQVVVLVVRDEDGAGEAARHVAAQLSAAGLRTQLDAAPTHRSARRVVEWELKGVAGAHRGRDRRARRGRGRARAPALGTKTTVPLTGIDTAVRTTLDEAQRSLLAEALERRRAATVEVASIDEALEAARTGFAVLPLTVLGSRRRDPAQPGRGDDTAPDRPDGGLRVPTTRRPRRRARRRGGPRLLTAEYARHLAAPDQSSAIVDSLPDELDLLGTVVGVVALGLERASPGPPRPRLRPRRRPRPGGPRLPRPRSSPPPRRGPRPSRPRARRGRSCP